MDPADTDSLHHARATQGALVGHQGKVIQEVVETLHGLNSRVHHLSVKLHKFHTDSNYSLHHLSDCDSVAPMCFCVICEW